MLLNAFIKNKSKLGGLGKLVEIDAESGDKYENMGPINFFIIFRSFDSAK